MKSFKTYLSVFLSILGIDAFSKNENDVVSLTEEQKNTLQTAGFKPTLIEEFSGELAKNSKDGKSENEPTENSKSNLQTMQVLALELQEAQAQIKQFETDKTANQTQIKGLEQKVTALENDIETLSKKPEDDINAGAQNAGGRMQVFNLQDEKQLGGNQGVMWSLNRPYNKKARAALLAKQGVEVYVSGIEINAELDLEYLKADLGAYYRTPRDKTLHSYIVEGKDVSKIFPTEYNVVDQQVVSNLFLQEFSRPHDTNKTFEELVKGGMSIEPEKVTMYDVLGAAYEFTKLKELEKSWVGHLCDDSSSIKLSFIEYIVQEISKQVWNEQQKRRIAGKRVNGSKRSIDSSDGLYTFIEKK